MGGTLGPIEAHMVCDHAEVDALLRRALAPRDAGTVDEVAFAAFRRRLLRHMALEEDVLLRYAEARAPIPFADRIREEHAEIRALLAGPAREEKIIAIIELLGRHNVVEEGPDGLYAACDVIAGPDADALVMRLKSYAPPKPRAGVAR